LKAPWGSVFTQSVIYPTFMAHRRTP
jgi:hypothetical protein